MSDVALGAPVAIGETGRPPAWVHLLPAGLAQTADGRGPYRVGDAARMIATSMVSGKLALDENHAIDRAAPLGGASPARGWIVELQERADGVWGRVEWLDEAGVPAWRQYRGVSPVIAHDQSGTITAILRASLTNTPNLVGLTALHSQKTSTSNIGTSEAQQIAKQAREHQAEMARIGVPIDYGSALRIAMGDYSV